MQLRLIQTPRRRRRGSALGGLGVLLAVASIVGAHAQTLGIAEYEPVSTLVVPEHPIARAKYPFIDVHSHQRSLSDNAVDRLVGEMDSLNLQILVNLSGGSGARLAGNVKALKGRYPDRFVVFANVSFDGIDDPGYGERAAAQLEQDVANGAQGLKIFKNLGMYTRDAGGKRVPTDDPRLDPIWRKCAELGIPVLIHTGEPNAFWMPHDERNERWLELTQFPNRKRDTVNFASFEQTMAEQHSLFRKHPETTFINAHLGWLGNNLPRLGELLDELPNMVTELGAVLHELGRQPRFARAWLIQYQDRVLMGKDIWNPTEFHTYFRTFETADEYFDYYRRRHAHWKIYGLDLPDEVLKKIYYKNALRVIPGLDASAFPE